MTTCICRICFQNGSHGNCPKCKLYSCETCYKLHLNECKNLIAFKYHLCKQHGYQLEGFCCECCQMTCGMCSAHSGHNVISTKLAVDNIARDLINVSRNMQDKEVQLNSSTATIMRMKCDIEHKIKNEERKWQSCVSNIKRRLLSEIEEDLKHDSQLQLHEILNEAKVNLHSLKKGCFTLTFLSKWIYVKSAMHLFEKVLKQRIEGIAQFENKTTSDFSQIFRSHMVHEEDRKEAHKLAEKHRYLQTENEMQTIRHHEEEMQKLNEQLRHLQTENEKMQQMIRVQIEERSYIDKVCTDMVKLTNKIPEKTKLGDLTIPATETETIKTLRHTLELTLNRLVEVNNNQIITEQQLKKQILSIEKWTDEQRYVLEQDRNVFQNVLKEQKSKISEYEKELQKRSDRLSELQASNGILNQHNFDLQRKIEHLGQKNGNLRARNLTGTSLDTPCYREIGNLTTMFAGASMGEKTNLKHSNSKTQDEIIDGDFENKDHRQETVGDHLCRYHEAKIHKLTDKLRNVQAENESMQQMIR